MHTHSLLYLNSCEVTASGEEDKMQSCGASTNMALLLRFTFNA